MSDHSFIAISSVILSAANDLTNAALLTLQKHADRNSIRGVLHFVRDHRRHNAIQRTLRENV